MPDADDSNLKFCWSHFSEFIRGVPVGSKSEAKFYLVMFGLSVRGQSLYISIVCFVAKKSETKLGCVYILLKCDWPL